MYTVNSIRNICLLGHSGSGKSALAESLLYMTGAIVRMARMPTATPFPISILRRPAATFPSPPP